jgi:hypothetical protein
MSVITVLAAIGIIVFVIGQQIVGSGLTGKRVLLLPLILTVIGIVQVTGHGAHATGTDYGLIGVSAAIAIAIGLALGAMTRIERRDGYLWAQLPKSGLWLWAGLIASRIAIGVIAHLADAHVAAGTSAILLTLGLNRVAQAAVVVPRAVAAGIPFKPERDGKVFAAGLFPSTGAGRI